MNSKKIWLSLSFLALFAVGFGAYVNAQEGGGILTQLFGREALVEPDRDFQYKDDLALNPGSADLESGPITGKITGDRLTAKEFNRLLELAAEGGSAGIAGISCGTGEVMVGIGEGGEPSCLQVFTETVADEGLLFGGMYGQWNASNRYPNALAGNTMGCPTGYTAQQVGGSGGWPGDGVIYFCYAEPGGSVNPVAFFGGTYGEKATGNGYVVSKFNNPLAGDTYGCPAGYTSQRVAGYGTFDRVLFYCYQDASSGTKIESFQGMYSPSNELYRNPKTGGKSCPAGAQSYQAWGSQFDNDIFVCYGDVAGGGTTTTVTTPAIVNQSCPDGDYLKGFDEEGDILCEPLPEAGVTGGGTGLGNDSLPTLLYEINDNTQTSLYACVDNVNLEEYCGDEDGCTIRTMSNHKEAGDDQSVIREFYIYMEEPTFSSNNDPAVYGRTSGDNNNNWINGTGTRRDSIFNADGWVWLLNYKDSNCTGVSHQSYAASDPYTFSFMVNPSIRTKIFIYDRYNEAPVQKWNPSCEEQGGNLLPDGTTCDFSGTVNVTGLDTDGSSEKCYVTINCPNGETVTALRFGNDDWNLNKCHAAFSANFPRYCSIMKDGSEFDTIWSTDSEGRSGWQGAFDLK